METADTTFTEPLGAVLRARERLGCPYLALAVRNIRGRDRACIIVSVPHPAGPGTVSRRVTAFRKYAHTVVSDADCMTASQVEAALVLGDVAATTPQQHTAFAEALIAYRARKWEAA